MPKAKKLPSGNYRVQVFLGIKDGKKIMHSITATSKDEAEYIALQYKRENRAIPSEYTVAEAIDKYIEARTNVLSPSTVQGYKKIGDKNLQSLMNIKVKKLTQDDVQKAVNEDAKTLSAKTVKNAHGLLSAMLSIYRPEMRLRTSMPKEKRKFKELPMPQKIFDAVKGSGIELPVLLAMWLSFSMSEIRGIMKSDIKNGVVTLNRVIVDVDNKPVIKESMKAYERSRRHVLPQYIVELIDKCKGDFIVQMDSYAIMYRWRKLLKEHDIPYITFHDLRHVNASVMHLLGVPDKYAMERGGWKTDQTMKAVYQNVFTDERLAVDNKINAYFDGIINIKKSKTSHENPHTKEKSPL